MTPLRRFINDVFTFFFAMALVVVIAASLLAAIAHGRPALTAAAECVGVPAPVRAQADGSGIRAGQVNVRCAGSWRAFQGVLWFSDSATQRGKWSYGGTRYVTGRGNTTIPAWLRPYHGCGYWKQQITIGSVTRYSDVTWFCA